MKNLKFSGKSLAIGAIALTAIVSPLAVFQINANASGTSGMDKAKAVALRDANLTESEVFFTKTLKKLDDNIQVYDIEFYKGNDEYEYEIAVSDLRIVERDHDIKRKGMSAAAVTQPTLTADTSTNKPASGETAAQSTAAPSTAAPTAAATSSTKASNGLIGVAKAKSIALADAGLSAGSVVFTKEKMDWDDGIQVYEIEFHQGNTEYDYEIAATTGTIRERKVDRNERPASNQRDWDDDHDDD